jgi:hypothetical protein
MFGERAVESHISPKTSEIWGTQVLLWGKVVRALMRLRPVLVNPRTLVRNVGHPDRVGVREEWMTRRVSSLRGSAKPRTRGPFQHSRSGKSGYAPVLMNKPERVHTGEQIHFPHLAQKARDMGHPHLRLGESFETCSFLP